MAAVLHYNVLPRILKALANRYMGLPLEGYFDDFAAIVPAVLGRQAMNAFARFARALGFELHGDKFDLGEEVAFLGLLGSSPSTRNGGQLRISLPEEKRLKWSAMITSYLKAGRISHRCLGKLIGRLSCAQTALFGKFARTRLRPLRRKMRRRIYTDVLPAYEKSILEWRASIAAEFTPRRARPRPLRPDWLIYTDAATTPAWICALLFYGSRSSLTSIPAMPPGWISCGTIYFATPTSFTVWDSWPSSYSLRSRLLFFRAHVVGSTLTITIAWMR